MPKSKSFSNLLLAFLSIVAFHSGVFAQNNLTAKAGGIQPATVAESDRGRDGLAGPVRRVRTEVAKLSSVGGRTTEDKRVALEVASYDPKGAKVENQYFPIAGSTLTGKEVYKYDDKGNISEMTLVNADGSAAQVELKNSSGSSRLDQSALDTVKRWRFVPAKLGVQAVTAWVLVPISFTLGA